MKIVQGNVECIHDDLRCKIIELYTLEEALEFPNLSENEELWLNLHTYESVMFAKVEDFNSNNPKFHGIYEWEEQFSEVHKQN